MAESTGLRRQSVQRREEEQSRYAAGRGHIAVRGTLLANVYLNLLDRIVENPKSEFWKYGLKMGLTRGRRGADPLLSTLLIQKITF
jgi:hypothetical protein